MYKRMQDVALAFWGSTYLCLGEGRPGTPALRQRGPRGVETHQVPPTRRRRGHPTCSADTEVARNCLKTPQSYVRLDWVRLRKAT